MVVKDIVLVESYKRSWGFLLGIAYEYSSMIVARFKNRK